MSRQELDDPFESPGSFKIVSGFCLLCSVLVFIFLVYAPNDSGEIMPGVLLAAAAGGCVAAYLIVSGWLKPKR